MKGGARGASTQTAPTQAPTHTRVLSHTYEGISLNGILSILRCPFLNGNSVKGKDTYVNNVFHTGLSGPATLGVFTVVKTLGDLNLMFFQNISLCAATYIYYMHERVRTQICNQFPVKTMQTQSELNQAFRSVEIRKLKTSCIRIRMRVISKCEGPPGEEDKKHTGKHLHR